MIMADCSLMSTHQPSLQQRGYSVAAWQKIVSHIRILPHRFMNIAKGFQTIVSIPSIGAHDTARYHRLLNDWLQAVGRSIRYPMQPNTVNVLVLYLRRYHNQCLPFSPTTAFPRLLTAKVGLINFNDARESISSGPHHRTPQLVQPRPRRLITTQPQNPLQPLRTGAILLAGHPPDRAKVHGQGQSGSLKDRSSLYRNLIRGCTFTKSSAGEPRLPSPASRACKPIRPPQGIQILNACRLGSKLMLKFFQGLGILLHALGYYILWLVESRRYPNILLRLNVRLPTEQRLAGSEVGTF